MKARERSKAVARNEGVPTTTSINIAITSLAERLLFLNIERQPLLLSFVL
ncbi:hypothetical protein [Desulfoscipio gibsoniae]|nr:hypothetical protein [Desulfoscipio gibsoniae]